MSFQRLLRFVNAEGKTQYGNLKNEATGDLVGQEVEVLEGDLDSGLTPTGRTEQIKEVCQLPRPSAPFKK
jgi:transcription initiation factor TFIIH subunit 2